MGIDAQRFGGNWDDWFGEYTSASCRADPDRGGQLWNEDERWGRNLDSLWTGAFIDEPKEGMDSRLRLTQLPNFWFGLQEITQRTQA